MSDEELVLLYYRDGLDAQTIAQFERNIAADSALRARYEALCADLDDIARPAPEPVPELARRRWHAALADAAAPTRARSNDGRSRSGWPLGIAAALLLGVAVGITVGLRLDEATPPGAPTMATAEARRPLVERGFAEHLRTSRAQLSFVAEAAPVERAALVTTVLEQNRLQQRVAQGAEAGDLLRLLRAFELVLLELAAEETDAARLGRLGARLDFEFQTTLRRLDRTPSWQRATRAPTPL